MLKEGTVPFMLFRQIKKTKKMNVNKNIHGIFGLPPGLLFKGYSFKNGRMA